jgi:nucleotide-binding universal stress UspA family protein
MGNRRGSASLGLGMFHRVLVGFDGSEQARDALALGGTLLGGDGELFACCVHRLDTLSARVDPVEPRLDRAAAERCVEQAGRLLEGRLAVRPVVVAGASTSIALHGAAEDQRADLLVLGSSHRGIVGRVLVGSVTTQALRGAPCAVAVAPVGYAGGAGAPLARIAVGSDVADPMGGALASGAALAQEMGAELRVVAVADTAAALAGGASAALSYAAVVKARLDAAEEGVARALEAVPAGVSASSEVRDGRAAEKLLEVTYNVDLLVLGSHGHGPVRRLVLGSVCDSVVRAAACAVLIVPPVLNVPSAGSG